MMRVAVKFVRLIHFSAGLTAAIGGSSHTVVSPTHQPIQLRCIARTVPVYTSVHYVGNMHITYHWISNAASLHGSQQPAVFVEWLDMAALCNLEGLLTLMELF